MSRGSDPVKVALWKERFARFKATSQTTEQFCLSEGVTRPNFYSWRRKLGLSTPRPRKPTRGKSSFQQMIVTSSPTALTASLPGGILLEVSGENALRIVVGELVRAGRLESESSKC